MTSGVMGEKTSPLYSDLLLPRSESKNQSLQICQSTKKPTSDCSLSLPQAILCPCQDLLNPISEDDFLRLIE